jgi:hypothetical protein
MISALKQFSSKNVVAQFSVVGLWRLSGVMEAQFSVVLAQLGCGGSVGLWWLSGVVEAQWGCGSSVGVW